MIQIFWGKTFGHYLCEYSLPILCAANNLPEWPYLEQTRLVIYCPQEDWEVIRRHASLKAAGDWVEVCWMPISAPLPETNKYLHMGSIHAQAIEAARIRNAGVILLGPDVIVCQGAFSALAEAVRNEIDVVLVGGPVVNLEDFSLRFEQVGPAGWDTRQSSRFIVEALHASLRTAHLQSDDFTCYPSLVLYPKGTELMARYFHLHPLMIRQPRSMQADLFRTNATIDGDYLCAYDPNETRFWIVQNQEIVCFSFDRKDEVRFESYPMASLDFRLSYVFQTAKDYFQPRHHWLFRHEVLTADLGSGPAAATHYADQLELVALCLACFQFVQQQDVQALVAAYAAAAGLAERLSDSVAELPADLLQLFLWILHGYIQLGQRENFERACGVFRPYLERFAQINEEQGRVLNSAWPNAIESPICDAIDSRQALLVIGLDTQNVTFGLETLLDGAAYYAQILLLATQQSASSLAQLEQQLESRPESFTLLMLDDLSVAEICQILNRAQAFKARFEPNYFLFILRALLAGKWR